MVKLLQLRKLNYYFFPLWLSVCKFLRLNNACNKNESRPHLRFYSFYRLRVFTELKMVELRKCKNHTICFFFPDQTAEYLSRPDAKHKFE